MDEQNALVLPPIDPRLVQRAAEFREHAAKIPQARERTGTSAQDFLDRSKEFFEDDLRTRRFEHDAARRAAEEQAAADREKAMLWRIQYDLTVKLCDADRADGWNARDEESVRTVRSWLHGDLGPRHLVLFGSVGCGKTIAQACAAKHWLEPDTDRGSVAWLEANDLISAMLHDYDDKAPRLAQNIIVDDVGSETKPGMVDALKLLFRLPGKRRLLISSNLPRLKVAGTDVPSFREKYPDPRLLSRLNHECTAVYLKGESLRRSDGGF